MRFSKKKHFVPKGGSIATFAGEMLSRYIKQLPTGVQYSSELYMVPLDEMSNSYII